MSDVGLLITGLIFLILIYIGSVVFNIWFGYSLLIHVQAEQGLWNLWIVAVILNLLSGGALILGKAK